MSPTPRRPARGLVAAALAAPLVLAGCGAGPLSQTRIQGAVIDGTNAAVGPIAIRYAYVPEPPDQQFAWEQGGDVPLLVQLINSGLEDDELVEVSSEAADEVVIVEQVRRLEDPLAAVRAGEESEQARDPGATVNEADEEQVEEDDAAGGTSNAPVDETTEEQAEQAGEGDASDPVDDPFGAYSDADYELSGSVDSVVVPPQSATVIGQENLYGVLLRGTTRELASASYLQVTFVFAQAGSVTVDVPVQIPLEPAPDGTERGGLTDDEQDAAPPEEEGEG